ncbi:MAG: triphosphoribosyl-dephospho-CoA synthase [Planctomycetaceae bacterium]
MPPRAAPPDTAIRAAVARIPAACPPWGRGWCAAAACILEAAAPKPGNVHPGADFSDLAHDELVAAALTIAPVMERAADAPLGRTVRDAVEASRRVTRSNANLGMILAIAPLAAVRGDAPPDAAGAAAVLAGLGPADAVDVWAAIAAARPGGLGTSERHDVAGPPPTDVLEAMRLAAPRDRIAALWADGYADLVAGLVADLAAEIAPRADLRDAIVRAFLRELARSPDSLVVRRHGPAFAADVSGRAAAVLAAGPDWRAAAAAFDRTLRSPVRVNPGTTADLVAAALYILLRDPARRTAFAGHLEPPPQR